MGVQHTKGPWSIRRNGLGGWDIAARHGPAVARTGAYTPENDSNASLISASPDLFAACAAWIEYLSADEPGTGDAEEALLDAMRASLIKATGGAA